MLRRYAQLVLNFEVDGDFFKKVAIHSVSAIIILRFIFFWTKTKKKKRCCREEIYRCCYLHKVRSRTYGLCVRTRVFFCTTTSTILCLAPCGISCISLHIMILKIHNFHEGNFIFFFLFFIFCEKAIQKTSKTTNEPYNQLGSRCT